MKIFNLHAVALIPTAIFLFIKLSTLSIRLSDTNVYFYTAWKILTGDLLYRDIFFTNFPLFPYISSLYLLLTGNNIEAFYFSSAIESSITSFLIYAAIYMMTKKRVIAFSGQILYLFSFMLLATTDHQSGVFLASLFTILSYLFFLKKRGFLIGVLTACTILTKAYFLPLAAAYFAYYMLTRQWNTLIKFILGAGSTGIVVLLPFLILASNELFADIVGYSLTRGAGIEKFAVIQFFALHDLVIFVVFIINLFMYKKHLFFALFSLFSIVFIAFYQDIYFLYLNFLLPITVVSISIYAEKIQTVFSLQRLVLPTIACVIAGINLGMYFSGNFHLLQKVDIQPLVQEITSAKPTYLYGPNDITPLLAFKTNTSLLNNITDTNTNLYRKGILDAKKLTTDAINKNSMIVSHGAYYLQFNIHEPIIDEIIVKERVLKECNLKKSIAVNAEGIGNQLNLFHCF